MNRMMSQDESQLADLAALTWPESGESLTIHFLGRQTVTAAAWSKTDDLLGSAALAPVVLGSASR